MYAIIGKFQLRRYYFCAGNNLVVLSIDLYFEPSQCSTLKLIYVNPYPTAFPYGNGMVLHFYQQQESSTTKTVHKVINKGLKTYV